VLLGRRDVLGRGVVVCPLQLLVYLVQAAVALHPQVGAPAVCVLRLIHRRRLVDC